MRDKATRREQARLKSRYASKTNGLPLGMPRGAREQLKSAKSN